MKKLSFLCILSALIVLFGSCGNSSQKVPFDSGDSAYSAKADPTLFGVCGVETSMNTLQLITDTGDTLMLDLTVARDKDQVFGGLQVGDRMAVIANDEHTGAIMVVNQAALLGNWVMPNPIDGSDEVGISIKEGGIAESIEQSAIIYKTWKLTRGKLEIVLVREGGTEEEETYLYDIVKVTPDSLVFKDAEDTFEYSRQKPKENYGMDVELEDAQNEFFM
ncbi:MAG: hypothetical protein IJ929_07810 [Prevotella sp.]|nr:hypothetical protein [Prevotella sp.]